MLRDVMWCRLIAGVHNRSTFIICPDVVSTVGEPS